MTKNAEGVLLKKSKLTTNGKPNLPAPSKLVEGELAINYAEGVETISTKNESGTVVTFSSDDYYTSKKLGEYFTGENSAKTVTEVMIQKERVTAEALIDLDSRKVDFDDIQELWHKGSDYATSAVKLSEGSTASGNYAVSEGQYTTASGQYSHAEGNWTTASTTAAHAEGYSSKASGYYAHAEGYSTTGSGQYSHAEGQNTTASTTAAHAEGYSSKASGSYAHAEGQSTSATSTATHAEGYYTLASSTYAHAEGLKTSATSNSSHSEGYMTKASGNEAHSEGDTTIAAGNGSHSEGKETSALSQYSHAEGYRTYVQNTASGSHVEGWVTSGMAWYTHAEGYGSAAIGQASHAEGSGTTANNKAEHASGRYNLSSSASTTWGDSGNTLFSVGNGTADNARHNAFEIRQNGDIYITNKNGNDVRLQDEIGNVEIDVDQVLDETTSASTNPVATQAVYNVYHEFETVVSAAINDLNTKKLEESDVEQVIDGTTSGSSLPVSVSAVCQYVDSHVPAGSVNADWDETDETSPAFILNKPFGDSCEYVTAYENTFTAQTVGPADYGIGGWSFSGAGTTFRYGDTYRITINGNVYVRNAIYFSGTYLGLNIEEGAENPYTNTWSIFNSGANVFASKEIALGDTVYLKVEQLICTTTLIDNKYVNSSWERGTGVNSVKLIDNGGTASGELSVSEGSGTTASGKYAHAEGYKSKASGNYSHAEGSQTSALTSESHAEGLLTIANGGHAEGYGSNSNGTGAHAEGYYTEAHAVAHAEGDRTKAKGYSSHAEGTFTVANGGDSHAEGNHTVTNNGYEHASGFYNVSSSASTEFGHSGNTLFSVGNGTYNEQTGASTRHNAFEIRQNGDIYIVSGSSDIKLQDYLGGGGSITVDQVLDDTTSASTNPVSSKAVYDAVTDNEMVWANAYVTISGAISSHTENVDIHLTSSEKAGLTKASTITSMAGYDLSQATATAIDPLTDTLLQAIAKLEKRIYDLEHPTNP